MPIRPKGFGSGGGGSGGSAEEVKRSVEKTLGTYTPHDEGRFLIEGTERAIPTIDEDRNWALGAPFIGIGRYGVYSGDLITVTPGSTSYNSIGGTWVTHSTFAAGRIVYAESGPGYGITVSYTGKDSEDNQSLVDGLAVGDTIRYREKIAASSRWVEFTIGSIINHQVDGATVGKVVAPDSSGVTTSSDDIRDNRDGEIALQVVTSSTTAPTVPSDGDILYATTDVEGASAGSWNAVKSGASGSPGSGNARFAGTIQLRVSTTDSGGSFKSAPLGGATKWRFKVDDSNYIDFSKDSTSGASGYVIYTISGYEETGTVNTSDSGTFHPLTESAMLRVPDTDADGDSVDFSALATSEASTTIGSPVAASGNTGAVTFGTVSEGTGIESGDYTVRCKTAGGVGSTTWVETGGGEITSLHSQGNTLYNDQIEDTQLSGDTDYYLFFNPEAVYNDIAVNDVVRIWKDDSNYVEYTITAKQSWGLDWRVTYDSATRNQVGTIADDDTVQFQKQTAGGTGTTIGTPVASSSNTGAVTFGTLSAGTDIESGDYTVRCKTAASSGSETLTQAGGNFTFNADTSVDSETLRLDDNGSSAYPPSTGVLDRANDAHLPSAVRTDGAVVRIYKDASNYKQITVTHHFTPGSEWIVLYNPADRVDVGTINDGDAVTLQIVSTDATDTEFELLDPDDNIIVATIDPGDAVTSEINIASPGITIDSSWVDIAGGINTLHSEGDGLSDQQNDISDGYLNDTSYTYLILIDETAKNDVSTGDVVRIYKDASNYIQATVASVSDTLTHPSVGNYWRINYTDRTQVGTIFNNDTIQFQKQGASNEPAVGDEWTITVAVVASAEFELLDPDDNVLVTTINPGNAVTSEIDIASPGITVTTAVAVGDEWTITVATGVSANGSVVGFYSNSNDANPAISVRVSSIDTSPSGYSDITIIEWTPGSVTVDSSSASTKYELHTDAVYVLKNTAPYGADEYVNRRVLFTSDHIRVPVGADKDGTNIPSFSVGDTLAMRALSGSNTGWCYFEVGTVGDSTYFGVSYKRYFPVQFPGAQYAHYDGVYPGFMTDLADVEIRNATATIVYTENIPTPSYDAVTFGGDDPTTHLTLTAQSRTASDIDKLDVADVGVAEIDTYSTRRFRLAKLRADIYVRRESGSAGNVNFRLRDNTGNLLDATDLPALGATIAAADTATTYEWTISENDSFRTLPDQLNLEFHASDGDWGTTSNHLKVYAENIEIELDYLLEKSDETATATYDFDTEIEATGALEWQGLTDLGDLSGTARVGVPNQGSINSTGLTQSHDVYTLSTPAAADEIDSEGRAIYHIGTLTLSPYATTVIVDFSDSPIIYFDTSPDPTDATSLIEIQARRNGDNWVTVVEGSADVIADSGDFYYQISTQNVNRDRYVFGDVVEYRARITPPDGVTLSLVSAGLNWADIRSSYTASMWGETQTEIVDPDGNLIQPASSPTSGLNQIQVDSRIRNQVEDWAEAGNSTPIPVTKLASGGLTQPQVDARVAAGVADWAESGNSSQIPSAKLPSTGVGNPVTGMVLGSDYVLRTTLQDGTIVTVDLSVLAGGSSPPPELPATIAAASALAGGTEAVSATLSIDTLTLSVSVTASDETPNAAEDVTFTANPEYGSTPYSYAWEYQSPGSTNWLSLPSETSQTYTSGGFSNATWSFRVTVTDNNGDTATAVSTITWAAAQLLTTPSSLSTTGTTETSFTANWGDVSNESGYRFQWRIGQYGSWTTVLKSSNATSHTVTGLTAGTAYGWRVQAIGTGAYSNSLYTDDQSVTTTAATITQLATPSSLSTSGTTSSGFTANWGDVANEDNYTFQWRVGTSGTWTDVSKAAGSTSHSVTGLSASTLHQWRVRANGSGSYSNSSWTSNRTVTTLALTPLSAAAAMTGGTEAASATLTVPSPSMSYVAFSDDFVITAEEAKAGASSTDLNKVTFGSWSGAKYLAFCRPASEGDFDEVYYYPLASPSTTNQSAGWFQLTNTLDIDGVDYNVLISLSAQTYESSILQPTLEVTTA